MQPFVPTGTVGGVALKAQGDQQASAPLGPPLASPLHRIGLHISSSIRTTPSFHHHSCIVSTSATRACPLPLPRRSPVRLTRAVPCGDRCSPRARPCGGRAEEMGVRYELPMLLGCWACSDGSSSPWRAANPRSSSVRPRQRRPAVAPSVAYLARFSTKLEPVPPAPARGTKKQTEPSTDWPVPHRRQLHRPKAAAS
jgi:hypothetical protein